MSDHRQAWIVRSFAGVSLTAVAIAATASPAWAQNEAEAAATDDEAAERNQIIVTAQFREQTLQSTPLAITAVSSELLEARGVQGIAEVASSAPNVTLEVSSGQRGNGLTAYIRGIGQYNTAPSYEPGVGTYIDDVYIASIQSSLLSLVDLDRVELLRGPQGTLAGKNSIGGAIKLFTKKPQGDGSGYVQAEFGSFNHANGRAGADFAISDNLFARVNVAAQSEDGFVRRLDYACTHPGSGLPTGNPNDDCELGTEGGISYVAGRLALRWVPSDRIEVNLAADYTDENSDPGVQLVQVTDATLLPNVSLNGVQYGTQFATAAKGNFFNYDVFCNVSAPGGTSCLDPRSETDLWGVSATIDVALSDNVSVKSITSYRAHINYNVIDGDGGPMTITNTQIGYRGNQFSQELRLNAQLMDVLGLTLGAYYLDGYINGEQRVDIQYINNLFFNDDDTDTTSKAVYGQAVLDVTDSLTLIGGLRYTKEFKGYTFYRTRPDSDRTPVPGLYGLYGEYRGDSVDYRVNASYQINDDLMVYAQYATGFKGGGINGQPFFPDQVYPFGPETIGTWEGGFKSQLWDKRVTFNMAGFYSDYEDIQLQAQTCPPPSTPFPCAGPQNVGSAHIKGVEAELFAEPIDGLQIDASAAYLDFDYYELINTPTITLDMVSPYTPEWSGSLGIQYDAQLGSSGSIVPRFDVVYRSHIYTDPVSNDLLNRIDGRAVANARLTYYSPDENWEVSFRVSNLFDKYYLQNLIDNTLFTGIRYWNPAAPRRWFVSVRRNF